MVFAIHQAETQLKDLALALGEDSQGVVDRLAQHVAGGGVHRLLGFFVLDEVAQLAAVFGPDGAIQGHGFFHSAQDAVDLGGGAAPAALDICLQGAGLGLGQLDGLAVFGVQVARLQGDVLTGGLAAKFLDQLALDAQQAVDGLEDVDGDADGAGLVGDGTADRLADPPGSVGAEFEAADGIKLGDGAQQADVAFLDQIQEAAAAANVAFGDADDQAQVGANNGRVGFFTAGMDLLYLCLQRQNLRAGLAGGVGRINGQVVDKGALGGQALVGLDVLTQVGSGLFRQGREVHKYSEGAARHFIPQLVVAAPAPVIQVGAQVRGSRAFPGMAQHLRFRKDQSQVRAVKAQAASIFHQPLPTGSHIFINGVIDAGRVAALGLIYFPFRARQGMLADQSLQATRRFQPGGQPKLPVRIQQLDIANFLQVQPHWILAHI